MYSEKRQRGNIAEDLVCNHLSREGFNILERNFLKKYGEIDIVAEKDNIIRFIEVKSSHYRINSCEDVGVSCETWASVDNSLLEMDYSPIENVHRKKQQRLARVIKRYILEKNLDDRDFEVDIVSVLLDHRYHNANLVFLENVLIS